MQASLFQRRKSHPKKSTHISKNRVNSVHTRCIVKTSGFTRGVCKNKGFYKNLKVFLWNS